MISSTDGRWSGVVRPARVYEMLDGQRTVGGDSGPESRHYGVLECPSRLIVAVVRILAGDELTQTDAEREHVRLDAIALLAQHFGRHVGRSAAYAV